MKRSANDASDAVRAGMAVAAWNNSDLCLAALALGGSLSAAEIGAIAIGTRPASESEYAVLSVALDERFADLRVEPRMRPWADLPPLG